MKQRFVLVGMLTSVILALVSGLAGLPVAPVTAAPQAISVGITSPAQGSLETTSTVMVTGTSTPGATLQLVVDGGAPIAVTADAGGDWSHTLTGLAQGPHTAQISAVQELAPFLYAQNPNCAHGEACVTGADTATGTIVGSLQTPQVSGYEAVVVARDGTKVWSGGGAVVDPAVTTIIQATTPNIGIAPQLGRINPAGTELWISHADGFNVFSTSTNAVLANVDTNIYTNAGDLVQDSAPHDVVFTTDGRYAYMPDRFGSAVIKVDTASRAIVSRFGPSGCGGRRIITNAAGTTLYLTCRQSSQLLTISTATDAVSALTFNTGSQPEGVALSLDESRLYVGLYAARAGTEIAVIDPATGARIGAETITLPSAGPRPLEINPHTGQLYVGANDGILVYDLPARTLVPGKFIATGPQSVYAIDFLRRYDTATATVSFTVNTTSDLVLTKTHAGSFTVGQPGVYTIAVSNAGPAPASLPLTITDTLPAGLIPTAATFPGGSCSTAGQTVTCVRTSGAVPAGTTLQVTLTVDVTPAAAGTVVNRACVATANESAPASNCDDDPTVVIPVANLAIEKTSDPFFVVGRTGAYSLTVTNLGPSPAAGPITVTDTLPTGLTYQSATGASCTAAGPVVTCVRAGAMARGSSFSIRLSVVVSSTAAGTQVNSACVDASTLDPVSADDCATVSTPVLTPGVTIHKAATPPDGFFVSAHDIITYTLDVTNTGSLTLTNVLVSDAIPLGTTYLTNSARPALAQGPSPAVWSVPTLMPGQHMEVSFAVRVAALGTTTEVRNVASVVSNETPPTRSNETVHPFDPTAVELMAFTAVRDGQAITVSWETARELDTAGFAIWLGLTPDRAAAIRQTQALIPASGSATSGAAYRHRLTSPFWLRQARLYVWLEETDTAATTTQYGPVELARFPIFIPLVRR